MKRISFQSLWFQLTMFTIFILVNSTTSMAQITPNEIEIEIQNAAAVCAAVMKAEEIRNSSVPMNENQRTATAICKAVARSAEILNSIDKTMLYPADDTTSRY
jgi:hypothetical protein